PVNPAHLLPATLDGIQVRPASTTGGRYKLPAATVNAYREVVSAARLVQCCLLGIHVSVPFFHSPSSPSGSFSAAASISSTLQSTASIHSTTSCRCSIQGTSAPGQIVTVPPAIGPTSALSPLAALPEAPASTPSPVSASTQFSPSTNQTGALGILAN